MKQLKLFEHSTNAVTEREREREPLHNKTKTADLKMVLTSGTITVN